MVDSLMSDNDNKLSNKIPSTAPEEKSSQMTIDRISND